MEKNITKPSILFIEHSGSIIGGGQFSVLGLLKALREKGYIIHVVIPHTGDYYTMLVDNGFAPMLADINPFKGMSVFRLVLAIWKMRKLIRAVNADIVHANAARAALVGGLSCIGTNIPVIWHLRVPGREPVYDFLLTLLSKRIIAISGYVAARIKQGKKKVIVIHNGVNPAPSAHEEPLQIKKHLGIGNEMVVGTVSQLIPSKGLEHFIRVADRVRAGFSTVRFLIIGGEVDDFRGHRNYLEELSVKLGIADTIIFTGFQKDIYPYYAVMDIFAFFSMREAFGRVVAEAMMAGLPVVSYNTGGIPEIVDNNISGYLVKRNDIEKAAEKIIFLLNNAKMRSDMGKKGKERAEKLFSTRRNAEKISSIYDELMQRTEA